MTRPSVVVVGLGPAGPDLTTAGAAARLSAAGHLVLRTERHPAATPWVGRAETCDDLYESHGTFEAVYDAVVSRLVARATEHGTVHYAIPGSPFVLERTVELLRRTDAIDLVIEPGMSFLDLAWGRLGVDPVEAGVRLVDGHRFAVDAAGAAGALLVAHCHANHVLSELKLAWEEDEPESAVVLQRLGLPDEQVTEVAWADLDRAVEADHLTSVFIPEVSAPVGAELVRFHGLVRTLREQCPWDQEQTHSSLTPYLVEEAYEVVEAIDELAGDDDVDGMAGLEEELGDLLYQVYFHAAIAEQAGHFTVADVARGIHDKLYRRHPHVFADLAVENQDEIERNWERIKAAEKGRTSVLDGVPPGLPGLAMAHKLLSKGARIGAPTVDPGMLDGDVGDQVLALVEAARRAEVDSDASLRRALARLRKRIEDHEATSP